MTVDKDERESLHFVLDYLLNERAHLEGIDPDSLQKGQAYYLGYSKPRGELFTQAAIFLRRVLGRKLHEAEMSLLFEVELQEDSQSPEVPATIASSIRSFLPLFMKHGTREGWTYGEEKNEKIEKIIADLMGIYWGDEPRFFATEKKRQGLHKRPYRLARLRLSALEWDKYLAAVGLSAFERHRIVSDAYRTEWEAIRKWAKSIEQQFDLRPYLPYSAEQMQSDFAENPAAVFDAIRRDGDAYWLEKSTASSGKDS